MRKASQSHSLLQIPWTEVGYMLIPSLQRRLGMRGCSILGLYHGRNSLPARKEESAQTLNHWVIACSTYRDLPYKMGEGGSTHKPSMWTLEVWPGELLGSP